MLQALVNPLCMMENADNDVTLARDLADVFLHSSVDLSLELRQALKDDDVGQKAQTALIFLSPHGDIDCASAIKFPLNRYHVAWPE